MAKTASYTVTCYEVTCTEFTRKTYLSYIVKMLLRVDTYFRKYGILGNLGKWPPFVGFDGGLKIGNIGGDTLL